MKCISVKGSILVLSLILFDSPTFAICGDADSSGAVTVTDGVQTLRAAAGLSSPCSANCDVDENGHITISDGVNVLRIAAGVIIAQTCSQNDNIGDLIGDTLPLFGALTKGLLAPSSAFLAGSQQLCENPEGTVELSDQSFVFHDCDLSGARFNGGISILGDNGVSLDELSFVDLETGKKTSLDGELSAQATADAALLSGVVRILYSGLPGEIPFSLDDLAFDKQALAISAEAGFNPQGIVVGGAMSYDSTATALGSVVSKIDVGFNGTSILPVTLALSDGTQRRLTFDAVTESISPN